MPRSLVQLEDDLRLAVSALDSRIAEARIRSSFGRGGSEDVADLEKMQTLVGEARRKVDEALRIQNEGPERRAYQRLYGRERELRVE